MVEKFIDKNRHWISLAFYALMMLFSAIGVEKEGFSSIYGFLMMFGGLGVGFNAAIVAYKIRTIITFYVDDNDEIKSEAGDEFDNLTSDDQIEILLISIMEIYSDSIDNNDFTRYIFNMAKNLEGFEDDYCFDESDGSIRKKELYELSDNKKK